MKKIQPQPKQFWSHKIGGALVRVMAVAEGFVMVRNRGAMPFLRSIGQFLELYDFHHGTVRTRKDRSRSSPAAIRRAV